MVKHITHRAVWCRFALNFCNLVVVAGITAQQCCHQPAILMRGPFATSAGGPGKGMHSRLYTRVLNQYPWMHNCTAINSIYNTTGLVGIFASAESTHAGMIDFVAQLQCNLRIDFCFQQAFFVHKSDIYVVRESWQVFRHWLSSAAEEMVSVLCRELQAVASDVPAAEVERAKAAAVSSVLMNLESRAVVAEDIGRQVLTYGHRSD